jgi:hypothetical protein
LIYGNHAIFLDFAMTALKRRAIDSLSPVKPGFDGLRRRLREYLGDNSAVMNAF